MFHTTYTIHSCHRVSVLLKTDKNKLSDYITSIHFGVVHSGECVLCDVILSLTLPGTLRNIQKYWNCMVVGLLPAVVSHMFQTAYPPAWI